jgi:GTP pyrophosphokinase
LLHDAAEDAGGEPRLEDIRRRFGGRVADYVMACTDTVESPKPPCRERKEAYIAHIASADPAALLISASDKLHNARAILRDFRATGDAVWLRFNGGEDGTLWYYRALVVAFKEVIPSDLVDELDRVVSETERLAGYTST